MAKITKDEELLLTAAEADALIRNADGRVCFGFSVSAFLHTTENRGYDGSAPITVSKAQARKLVKDLLHPAFEAKGARIKLHLKAPDPRFKGSSAWIFIH